MAKECYVCREKINIFNSQKGKSGRICMDCYKKLTTDVRRGFFEATKDAVLRSVAVWEDCQKVAENMSGSPKKQCANCGSKIGAFNRKKLGTCLYICDCCYDQCSLPLTSRLSEKTLSDVKKDISRMSEHPEFTPTHIFGKVSFDDVHRLWKADQFPVFQYEEIRDYEIVEEREEHTVSNTIEKTKTKSGGVGRAVVGGALFGPAGAIVGSNTGKRKSITQGTTNTTSSDYYVKLGLKIMLSSIEIPSITVDYIKGSTPVTRCNKVIDEINSATGFIDIMLNAKSEDDKQNNKADGFDSITEEIVKFKELLDSGIITEEEFNAKKKQLLGV